MRSKRRPTSSRRWFMLSRRSSTRWPRFLLEAHPARLAPNTVTTIVTMSGNVFCQKMGDMLFYRLHPIRYPGIRTAAAVGKRPAGSTPGFSTSITSALSTLHRPIRLIGARHFDPVLLWHSVHGQAPLPERELETDRGARARAESGQREARFQHVLERELDGLRGGFGGCRQLQLRDVGAAVVEAHGHHARLRRVARRDIQARFHLRNGLLGAAVKIHPQIQVLAIAAVVHLAH